MMAQGLNRGVRPRSTGNPLLDAQAEASKGRRGRPARASPNGAGGDSESSVAPPPSNDGRVDGRVDGPRPGSGRNKRRGRSQKGRTGSGSPADANGTSSDMLATRMDPGNAGAPQGHSIVDAPSHTVRAGGGKGGKVDASGDSDDEEVILMKPAASKSGKGTATTATAAGGRERSGAAAIVGRESRRDVREVEELLRRNSIREGQEGNGTPAEATAQTARAKVSERPQSHPRGRAATAPSKGHGSTGSIGRGSGRQRKPKGGEGKEEETKEEPLLCGEGPDVRWRCVPEEHLRAHPLYHGLPQPEDVVARTIIDVSRFRQSSWQWDALHDGRCTTSRAAACLGFYEPLAAELLRVPRSLQGHHKAVDAWLKLLQPPLASLDLLNDSDSSSSSSSPSRPKSSSSRLWRPPKEGSPHWSHSYHPPPPRRGGGTGSGTGSWGSRNVRMAWGNAQEATSVLTALNYFATTAPGSSVAEVGLCPAEAHYGPEPTAPGAQHGPPLLLGASPDGVVVHPDGTFEALEVKNHSPYWYDRSPGVTAVRDPGPWAEIANWHVPQLALEMYCMGPRCRGVLFVSQSATKGAAIMRLRRDDGYIELMLSELRLFHRSFVVTGAEPPEGFGSTRPSHRRLLDATLRASAGAEVVAVIPNHKVQRSPWGGKDTMFLWPASHPPPPARREQQHQ